MHFVKMIIKFTAAKSFKNSTITFIYRQKKTYVKISVMQLKHKKSFQLTSERSCMRHDSIPK